MLPGGLSSVAALTAVSVLLSACADGTERGAIRENVIEPGITAIAQASALACSTDADVLRTALQTYEMFEGQPAPGEEALVEADVLLSPSPVWDVVDGDLVAQDPGCE